MFCEPAVWAGLCFGLLLLALPGACPASVVTWCLVGPKWPHLWLGQQSALHHMSGVLTGQVRLLHRWSQATRSPGGGKPLPMSHLLSFCWLKEVMLSPDIAVQMERASFCAGRSYSHMAAGMDTGKEGAAAGEGSVFARRHMSVPIRQQHSGSPAVTGDRDM